MRLKRLIYTLLLNFLVAGLATVGILTFWEQRSQQPLTATVIVTVLVPFPVEAQATPAPLATAPSPSPAAPGAAPSQTPVPLQPYIVQKGDILSKIAVLFKVSVDDILRANHLSDPNSIYVGQELLIPMSALPTETPVLPPTDTPTITPTPRSTDTPSPTPTTDTSPARLVIESVMGAGIQGSEQVKIVHTGGGAVSLENWRLENGAGQVFVFPRISLFPGAVLYVHSEKGANSVTDLYWGSDVTLWKAGATATLRDNAGKVRTAFTLP